MKLQEAVLIWLAQQKPSTRRNFERRIRRCVGLIGESLPMELITVSDLHRYSEVIKAHTFQDKLGETHHYAPRTIREEFKVVKIFFNWAVAGELIDKSPARFIQMPYIERDTTRAKAMTDKDLQTLLAYTQNMIREHAMIRFASESACRRGEMCSLRLSNLNLDNPIKFYDPALKQEVEIFTALVIGKTGEREVGFYKTAAQALRRYILQRPICDHDYVFVTAKKKPITDDYADLILRRLAAEIEEVWGYKLEHWNIHSMRHRVGHAMGDLNTPLTLIATKLGHSDERTTMTYLPKDANSAWSRAAIHTVEPKVPDEEERKIIDLTSILKRGG